MGGSTLNTLREDSVDERGDWVGIFIFGATALSFPLFCFAIIRLTKALLKPPPARRVVRPAPLDDLQRQKIDDACPRLTAEELADSERAAGQCAICLGPLVGDSETPDGQAPGGGDGGGAFRRLPCNHVFHAACVDPWLYRGMPCALCRFDPLQAAADEEEERDEEQEQDVERGLEREPGRERGGSDDGPPLVAAPGRIVTVCV